MEKDPRSTGDEEFDWWFSSQNPTDSFPPPPAIVNGGSALQDHRHYNLDTTMGSSSMRSVNHNDGFPVDNGVFPFQNRQQHQLPAPAMGGHFGSVNPVRSIMDHRDNRYPTLLPDFREYNPYDHSCNSCNPDQMYCVGDFHPGVPSFHHRSPLTGFPQTPYDRNLEIDFSRLNISSSNHHLLPFLASPPPHQPSNIRNHSFLDSSVNMGNVYPQPRLPIPPAPAPVNRNPDFHDLYHSPRRDNFDLNSNPIRSTHWIRDYQNPISRPIPQSRSQVKRLRFPTSLKEIRGLVFLVAKDQEGCQFLQNKCEDGKPEEIEMIFNEVKDHIRELMVDASMNYLAQKLFIACNERQMTHIVVSVTTDKTFTSICLNSHGTRAMQKLVELLTTAEQRSLIVSALRRATITLINNTNGHHVIQHCLKVFHVDEIQPVLDVVADHCLDIATDRSGCCALQQCVNRANVITKERIITDIIVNALHLSEHPYGNYVVQHVLGMQIPEVSADIMQRLSGNFVSLALNKHASNVVEKFLKEGPEDLSYGIIREIINSQSFLTVIQHPYGNYVMQSALHTAKDSLKELLIGKIQKEYASLHSHPHGKRVLALAKNCKPKV